MKLEGLDIRGFKTFSNVSLELSSLAPGLHFVRGRNLSEPELESNGSGKSSLFGALFWCLFGKTVDGLRGTDVRPWALKGPTHVAVRLDGSTVSRTLAPNRTAIDGDDAGPEQIEKLLGFGYDLASHTVLMGQGRPLFLDLPPARKMGLLSEALGLDRWEERSRKAAERVSELEGHLGSLDSRQQALAALAAELKAFLEEAKAKATEWDAREQVDLQAVETELTDKDERLKKAQDAHAKADLDYDGAQTELRNLAPEIRGLLQQRSDTAIRADRRKQLIAEIKALDRAKTCPTCGQPIVATTVAEHKAELQAKLDLLPIVGSLEDIEERLRICTAAEGKFQAKSNKAMDARTQALDQVLGLQAEVSALKKSLVKRQEEENPFQGQIMDLRKRRAEVATKLKALMKEIEDLQRQLEQVKFWVKGFKEVRLFIIEEILQEMELVTNSSLEEVGLVGWEVHYEVERETKAGTTSRGLNVWVQSPTNSEAVRWECWSGGESQRLKIIGAAALNDVLLAQVGATCNFECWDEQSQFLSESGVEDLVEFLANRAEDQGKIIFMVDHVAIESARFASTITVTKKGGISTLQA